MNQLSSIEQLGKIIRSARKTRGWTIAELADRIGRSREWLNRAELGHSEWGEYSPLSKPDLEAIIINLGGCFSESPDELRELRDKAELEFAQHRPGRRTKQSSGGKLTQSEIIMGEDQLYRAAARLIEDQSSDAAIRNTGIWSMAPWYLAKNKEWEKYRRALGKFLSQNPTSMLKRVEYVGSREHLNLSMESDKWLAGSRQLNTVHNAKVRYLARNPLLLDVIIGQREAIICLPQRTSYAAATMGIIVRDKLFVEALRTWFDEVLWDHPVDKRDLTYQNFDKSFKDIMQMYGFETKSPDE